MATKKVYLVDTENVGSTWKDLLPAKSGTDQILLFFTENSPYVSYLDLQLILQFPDRFEMIKCNPGKNGLDFQLVSYLGYLMKTASKANYVIVSNDGGFDAVVKFWQDRGMSISRMNVHRALQADAGQAARNAGPAAKQEPRKGGASPAKKVVHGQKSEMPAKAFGGMDPSTDSDTSTGNMTAGNPDGIDFSTDSGNGTGTMATRDFGGMNFSMDSDTSTGNMTAGNPCGIDFSTDSGNGTGTMATRDFNGTDSSIDSDTGTKNMTAGDFGETDSSMDSSADTGNITTGIPDRTDSFPDPGTMAAEPSDNETNQNNWKPAENPVTKTADTTGDASTKTASATDSVPAKKSATTKKRATTAKSPVRARARKSAGNTATAQEIPPEGSKTTGDTETAETEQFVANTMLKESATGNPDTSTEETANNPAMTVKPADPGTPPEAAPKGKTTRATRASTKKKAQAEDEPAAKAPAGRQRKTSAIQPADPASMDPENMELDFSNLTVSEKAALLRKYLPKEFSENPESLDIISDIMFGHDTTNHHQLHLAFVKNFGDEKGTLIYKAFRPHLAEFRA